MKNVLMVGLISLCFSSGCAYMVNGTKQDVTIQSLPKDAEIRNNGTYLGSGSVTSAIDRDVSQNITVSREGYDDAHVYLRKRMSAGWAVWDFGTCVIPVTLCIPVLVDAISGAWNTYDDLYSVKLSPKKDLESTGMRLLPAKE